jgi:hypothetical protein
VLEQRDEVINKAVDAIGIRSRRMVASAVAAVIEQNATILPG